MGLLILNKLNYFNLRKFSSKIMKYLNVAEKNDAAKGISAILSRGASNRREGYSPYNKIYEFDTEVFGRRCHMVMTSVSGHLLNYEFHPSFRSWESCNPVDLFDAPIHEKCIDGNENVKKTLEKEIRTCDGLIIWTDCDREGENIGYEIINVCKAIKGNIDVYRAKFSEITGTSIFRALNNLGRPNKNISDAVDVRKELDLRTGAAFTRLQTLRLQKVFPGLLADKLISYGSCQFPTLGFVVDRYLSIENFISEPFWKIKMNHKVKDLTTEFLWKRDRLFDKNSCLAILDICKESNLAKIESVDSRSKSKWRPLPLDTVEMEKNISRKLKINAKTSMKIAEKLYTQGFISYPRTETNIYPKELNLTNLVEQQTNDNNWGPFAQRIINEGGPTPRVGKKSDQAHPPIHPIKHASNLTGQEKAVYEYIVRHFLASVHKDAQGFETTIIADLAEEKFQAKGLIILEKNYLDVYIYEKWSGKEVNNYEIGDTFTPTVLEMNEGKTSAPNLLTEAELIALMDKHGIGTDATHADHIDTIKTREYVGLHENTYFLPGQLGMGLVEGYNNIGLDVSLAKPILRAEFENDLKLICEGVKNPNEVKQEQIRKYKAVFQTVTEKIREIDQTLGNRLNDRPVDVQDDTNRLDTPKPVLKCPKCGGLMYFRNRKNGSGKFISCSGYPSCSNAIWPSSTIETAQVLDESCPNCGNDTKKVKLKFKQNPFIGEPNPTTLCIGGCDSNVLETLEIAFNSVRRQSGTTTDNTRTTSTTNNNQTNNRRQSNIENFLTSNNNRSNGAQNNTRSNGEWLSNNFAQSNRNNTSTTSNNVVCQCNKEAVLRVTQQGPNKGKKYYKCENGACPFFLWDPDNTTTAGPSTSFSSTNNTNNDTINCTCNEPAKLLTVMKNNENHGRKFYVCSKPQTTKCNFFQWADEENQNQSNSRNNNDGGGGGGVSRGKITNKKTTRKQPYDKDKPKTKRKCGICGEEGHTKNKCPNKNFD